jgi:hypothetical protein
MYLRKWLRIERTHIGRLHTPLHSCAVTSLRCTSSALLTCTCLTGIRH